MSSLQCLSVVKSRSRTQSSKAIQLAEQIPTAPLLRPRRIRTQNEAYQIEIVEEQGGRVKVHYIIGYGKEYDEWKPKDDIIINKPVFDSNEDPGEVSPLTELACTIKKKLLPSKVEDTLVRIQVPKSMSTFRQISERGTPLGRKCITSMNTAA